ncbi:Sapep family Mn(2+)-dependent dipeptidase [Ruminococcus sp. FC2018]|uniref:Sapep family Mn(2+)-dependent dipeptidase n=1 Tax=Ruminococcus sp. FC2018 TaxID=1410617 RepID=UPI00048D8AA5|nr:Sapep family Mn(2+)-dependent dipeptidase [Ruminococcus sp. FC2018]
MLEYKQEFEKYFESHMDEIVASLGEIIGIESVATLDSSVKPFGEGSAKALKWGEDFLRGLGMKTKNVDNYAVHGDFKEGEPVLAILSHLDTVPAGEGWSYDPFKLTCKDGILYGRGTIDDKGPSVAVLYAVKAIRDLNIPINRNFRVVFGGFEEGGCDDIKYYQKKYPFPEYVFTPDGTFPVLNCEKGMIHLTFRGTSDDGSRRVDHLKAGTVINAVPGKAEFILSGITMQEMKDACHESEGFDLLLETESGKLCGVITGRSAHASLPQNGLNTATALTQAFSQLGISGFDKLSRIFVHGDLSGKAIGLGFADEISGDMTCVLTQLEKQGQQIKGGVDIRFPINKTSDEIYSIIKNTLEGSGFEITSLERMEPHYVDENCRLVQTLLKVYEGVSGKKGECRAEGGITYVHNTPGAVAFGAEFPWENNNMHGADEHIRLETFKANLNMYANAIVELTK